MALNQNIDELLKLETGVNESGQSGQDLRTYIGQPHHHTDSVDAVLYGGLLLGQAADAAMAHANQVYGENYRLHSLRAYFLRRANAKDPISYQSQTLRRGRSFAANAVQARQNDRLLLDFNASFHTGEPGFAHQADMPDVNQPNDQTAVSPTQTDLRTVKLGGNSRPMRFSMPLPAWIDIQNSRAYIRDGQVHLDCWMRTMEGVADNFANQIGALVYLSDYCTMATVAYEHDAEKLTNLFVVSLDHAMWLYNTPQVNQWHLYSMTSPVCRDGRGLSLGRIYGRDGSLWATFAQEGLLRSNTTPNQ